MPDDNKAQAPNPLSDTMTVTYDGDHYIFAIPSLVDEMKIGIRMRDIRRRILPEGDISDFGLDQNTLYFNRACATFELMLRKTSANPPWPYSSGPSGPVVDCEKFPTDKASTVIGVYGALQQQLLTFREKRPPAGQPAPEQAVGGGEGHREQGGG